MFLTVGGLVSGEIGFKKFRAGHVATKDPPRSESSTEDDNDKVVTSTTLHGIGDHRINEDQSKKC